MTETSCSSVLAWAYAECQKFQSEDFGPPEISDFCQSIWVGEFEILISDSTVLRMRFSIHPISETAILDGTIGERHITREVRVITDFDAELISIWLFINNSLISVISENEFSKQMEDWRGLLNRILTGRIRDWIIDRIEEIKK